MIKECVLIKDEFSIFRTRMMDLADNWDRWLLFVCVVHISGYVNVKWESFQIWFHTCLHSYHQSAFRFLYHSYQQYSPALLPVCRMCKPSNDFVVGGGTGCCTECMGQCSGLMLFFV